MDIFRRRCKLNFRPIQGQVKSHRFSEQIGARKPYYHFLYKFLGIISQKQLEKLFWKLIGFIFTFENETGLDLDL